MIKYLMSQVAVLKAYCEVLTGWDNQFTLRCRAKEPVAMDERNGDT